MSTPAPPSDLYAILGVPPNATPALIDQAYRALVRRYHPDSRITGDAALAVADDTKLRDVMAAYLVLGHPDRRADFDRSNRTITAPAVDIRVHRHTRHQRRRAIGERRTRLLVPARPHGAGPAYENTRR